MRKRHLTNLIVLLLLAAIAYCCGRCLFSAESSGDDIQAFGNEVPKLIRESGLKMRVAVCLLSPRLYGAACETPEARVIVIDHGLKENIESLRHELDHLRRFELGDPQWKQDKEK